MASQLGKRYRCEVCGTEILCVKPGDGKMECCGKEMQPVQPKNIAGSD
jgi:desulfoferrodoxin-like iron-binding protein